MADKNTLSDVIDRLKAEGQLTRNSGSHSLKSIKEILSSTNEATLSDKEDKREAAVKSDRQLGYLEKMAGAAEDGKEIKVDGVAGGAGLLAAAGGMLSGVGIGGGALAAGIGIMAAGGGYLLSEIGKLDGENIKKQVLSILSIGDAFEDGKWALLAEAGTLGLAMGAIGAGLLVFGVGSAVAKAAATFEVEGWADGIVTNVTTLLGLKDELGGNIKLLADGVIFGAAMIAIGTGLAVFGAGSSVAGMADGLTQFVKADDWAQNIKDRVTTLMSIKDDLGGNVKLLTDGIVFAGAMTAIAAGVAIFGVGAAGGAAGVGFADGLAMFTGEADFAQKIKDRVKTLVSIKEELGGTAAAFGEAGTFLAVMTALGTGMAVFGGGSAVVGLAEGINKFTGEEDWAQKIKDNVKTLVSITPLLDGDGEGSKATLFATGLAKIGLGLTAFGVGGFVGTLGNAATAILSMFGVKSPFTQIMAIAENADDLAKGADALDKIAGALNAFGNIRVSNVRIDFEDMAKDLAKAIPFLQKLATGGKVGDGWFDGAEVDFGKGILDPTLRLDELAGAVSKINYVLSGGASRTGSMKMEDAEAGAKVIAGSIPQIQELSGTVLSNAQTAESAASAYNRPAPAFNTVSQVDASSSVITNNSQTYVGSDMDPYSKRRQEGTGGAAYGYHMMGSAYRN